MIDTLKTAVSVAFILIVGAIIIAAGVRAVVWIWP